MIAINGGKDVSETGKPTTAIHLRWETRLPGNIVQCRSDMSYISYHKRDVSFIHIIYI